MIETLHRQMRRADARQLLRHDDLLVERGAHSAILLGPVRRDPALARERVIPGHQLRGRRTHCAAAQRDRKIGFQPCPHFHAEFGFGGRVTTEHGDEISLSAAGTFRELHSTLILAAFTTAVHCASSSASILPNSSGVPILISAPSASIRARVSGGARLSRNAALSLSMISGRRPGRRHDAEPEWRLQPGIARLRPRSARPAISRLRCGAGDRQRAQPPGLDVRQDRGHRVSDHLDLARPRWRRASAPSRDRARARC